MPMDRVPVAFSSPLLPHPAKASRVTASPVIPGRKDVQIMALSP
jgi:hypothetical protein